LEPADVISEYESDVTVRNYDLPPELFGGYTTADWNREPRFTKFQRIKMRANALFGFILHNSDILSDIYYVCTVPSYFFAFKVLMILSILLPALRCV